MSKPVLNEILSEIEGLTNYYLPFTIRRVDITSNAQVPLSEGTDFCYFRDHFYKFLRIFAIFCDFLQLFALPILTTCANDAKIIVITVIFYPS